MKLVLLAICLLACPVFAQTGAFLPGRTGKVVPAASAAVIAGDAAGDGLQPLTAGQIARLQSENQKIRFELIASVDRLSNLDKAITKASDRADSASIRSSWLAFLTVVFSFAFGLVGQYFLIRHQRRLNQEQERAKISNSYIEWQLKQLSELYGPLRALLGQSIAIYRQMNMCLIAADDKKFRMDKKPGADFDDVEFQIYLDGKWEQFRTVEHLPLVYKKDYGVEPYFDDVVKAGAAIAELIRKSAGYVRQEDAELIKVMGTYLAHYGVLCRLHDRAENGEEVHPTAADIKASFPRAIHKLVDTGFNAINAQIMEWKSFRLG
jgi:hypothetical protein